MSLANLSIDVTVNTGQAQRGLREVGSTAREQFDRSGAAVDDFRAEILAASSALDRAARSMGAGMDRAATEIEASSARSEQAIASIGDAANDVKFNGLTERVSAAFEAAFGAAYAGTQTYLQKTEDFVVAKGKAIAIGLAITAVSAAAGAVYAAYKVVSGTLGFVKGLFTGESYKADSIDRLIARNTELMDGNSEAKQKAMALDVLLEKSMRENGEELDRLGVRYKDANGKLLDHQQFLRNVKGALEEYAQGYDRVKAAEAIGIGSLDDVNAALADHTAALKKAKDRNDDYLLAIGPQGQAEIARYQAAIKEFNDEMQRTSDGFSHAIADSIMPALTDLAEFFKDGWPVAVRWFRGSLATITSLFYGLKMAADVALEAIRAGVQVTGEMIAGVASATVKAFRGDFSGAADDMKRAWQLSGIAVSQALDQVAKDAEKNRDRMALAFGLDGLNAGPSDDKSPKGSKTFIPKPQQLPPALKSPYQTYLDELDRMAVKVEQNEYASLRLKAAQLAQKEGITDLTKAYEAIDRVQRGDSFKVTEQHSQALYESANAFEFETSLIGKNVIEQEKLIAAYRERQQVDQLVRAAQRSGRPLDQLAIDDLNDMAAAWIRQAQAQIEARDRIQRSFDVGVATALSNYVRNATDAAANVANLITGSLQRTEDAFISWARTGKLSAKDLFSFMAEEYLRQIFRMSAARIATNGIGGFLSDLGQIFGVGRFTLANGIDYVPFNGYPATLHEGETVLTRQQAQTYRDGGAGGNSVSVGAGQVIQIGQGVSRAEVVAAINAANRQSEARIQRGLRQGSFA